jgi:phage gpG-like protein
MAGVGVEMSLTGMGKLERLSKAVSRSKLQQVAKTTWYQTSRYIIHSIQTSMVVTALSETGHSIPGNAPAIQSGNLAASIAVQVNSWRGFEVYSNVSYAAFLEDGTSRMGARPYLEAGLKANLKQLERVLMNNLIRALKI